MRSHPGPQDSSATSSSIRSPAAPRPAPRGPLQHTEPRALATVARTEARLFGCSSYACTYLVGHQPEDTLVVRRIAPDGVQHSHRVGAQDPGFRRVTLTDGNTARAVRSALYRDPRKSRRLFHAEHTVTHQSDDCDVHATPAPCPPHTLRPPAPALPGKIGGLSDRAVRLEIRRQ